ncbi:MAG: hypothetical protein QOD06_2974 [Candidatus Binatota bacterium]|jgi:hypothetical protein|nr:hypothetical protein [Candidatus Binatota bacterium]
MIAKSKRTISAAAVLVALTGTANAGPEDADSVGLRDPETLRFALKVENAGGPADVDFQFGRPATAQLPIAGDWDGDGVDTVGVYSPSKGRFQLRLRNTAGPVDIDIEVGPDGLLPVAGDWDGDGEDSVGVFDPDSGEFLLRNPLTSGDDGTSASLAEWQPGFLPIAGDWNGDGTDSIGLYDPATGRFLTTNRNVLGATATKDFTFGPGGADFLPIAGDWDGNGRDSAGLYKQSTGAFRLRNRLSRGKADMAFSVDGAGENWLPVAGRFRGVVIERDSTDGPEGFLWKPVSDGGGGVFNGKLALAMDEAVNGKTSRVEVHSANPPSGSTLLERGIFRGNADGGPREVWRYVHTGCFFGKNVWAMVYLKTGEILAYPIPDGCERID